MNARLWDRSLLITAIAVAIISSISVWLAWQNSTDLAQRISIGAVAPILSAAIVSYSLRILRFHYFLTRSGVPLSLRGTAVVQAVGFALSVTPGHIGEVFKLHLIRERVGTPVMQTAPLLLLDRFTEGGGFFILAVAATLFLPAVRTAIPTPSLILAGLALIAAFALLRYLLGRRSPAGSFRLPDFPTVTRQSAFLSPLGALSRSIGVLMRQLNRVLPHLENLWRGLESSFTLSQILGGLALSAVARFADGLVILFAAQMLGVPLALPAAVLVLAVSGLAGGFSFLPAGTGAVETTMVGLLILFGVTLSNALAITLIARLSTLWMWVALGLVVAFFLRLRSARAEGI